VIIDAHLHLWVNEPEIYPWSPIGGYIPEREAPLSRYVQIMDENGLDGAVLVQPTPYGWDNTYLLACKKSNPDRFRAVVLVDPLSDRAAKTLETLVELGADGLRINLHLQPIHHWENAAFFALLDRCAVLHLPVCLQTTPDYLDFIAEFAAAYDTQFIIDHLGRPKTSSTPGDEEFIRLLQLAAFQNVYVKLSGMNYYSAEPAPYRDTWPLLSAVKGRFGAEHCLWGSDFPFVEEHWTFKQNLCLIREVLGFTEDDLDWILGKSARNIWWGD
jgi:predicted TIM-barrel fold metal-dependent hydrolase